MAYQEPPPPSSSHGPPPPRHGASALSNSPGAGGAWGPGARGPWSRGGRRRGPKPTARGPLGRLRIACVSIYECLQRPLAADLVGTLRLLPRHARCVVPRGLSQCRCWSCGWLLATRMGHAKIVASPGFLHSPSFARAPAPGPGARAPAPGPRPRFIYPSKSTCMAHGPRKLFWTLFHPLDPFLDRSRMGTCRRRDAEIRPSHSRRQFGSS